VKICKCENVLNLLIVPNDKENIIVIKSFNFALKIVQYCELLEKKRKFVVAHQLLKSGTSIGANVREAQNCESKAAFIHKIKLALKEAEETEYWLLICLNTETYPSVAQLSDDVLELKKILSKIIISSKSN